MQYATVLRSISIWLYLLFVANVLSISLPISFPKSLPNEYTDITPSYSIHTHLIESRQNPTNLTAYFIAYCGENFVPCGNFTCCTAGNECLLATQSHKTECGALSGTNASPSASASPTSSPSNSTPTGAIAGGVIGGLALIAGLLGGLYYFHHRANPPPAIPQAPYPNSANIVEAKYLPSTDTSNSGDNWHPGTLLLHGRNRGLSVTDPYDQANLYPLQKPTDVETPQVMELSDSPPTPIVELPGEVIFVERKIPEQEHNALALNERKNSIQKHTPSEV